MMLIVPLALAAPTWGLRDVTAVELASGGARVCWSWPGTVRSIARQQSWAAPLVHATVSGSPAEAFVVSRDGATLATVSSEARCWDGPGPAAGLSVAWTGPAGISAAVPAVVSPGVLQRDAPRAPTGYEIRAFTAWNGVGWVATEEGLFRVTAAGATERVGPAAGLDDRRVLALSGRADGLYVATASGIVRLDTAGRSTAWIDGFEDLGDRGRAAFVDAPDGRTWLHRQGATGRRSYTLAPGATAWTEVVGMPGEVMGFDTSGQAVLAAGPALFREDADGAWRPWRDVPDLANVAALTFDRAGRLHAATNKGLYTWLPDRDTWAPAALTTWLDSRPQGTITYHSSTSSGDLPARRDPGPVVRAASWLDVHTDRAGRVWAVRDGATALWDGTTWTETLRPGGTHVDEAPDGGIWAGAGRWDPRTGAWATATGAPDEHVGFGADGAVWLAGKRSVAVGRAGGPFRTVLDVPSEVVSARVVFPGPTPHLLTWAGHFAWSAADGTFARVDDARVRAAGYTSAGLPWYTTDEALLVARDAAMTAWDEVRTPGVVTDYDRDPRGVGWALVGRTLWTGGAAGWTEAPVATTEPFEPMSVAVSGKELWVGGLGQLAHRDAAGAWTVAAAPWHDRAVIRGVGGRLYAAAPDGLWSRDTKTGAWQQDPDLAGHAIVRLYPAPGGELQVWVKDGWYVGHPGAWQARQLEEADAATTVAGGELAVRKDAILWREGAGDWRTLQGGDHDSFWTVDDAEIADGRLWLGTTAGLLRFDPATNDAWWVPALAGRRVHRLAVGAGRTWAAVEDQLIGVDAAGNVETRVLPGHRHVYSLLAASDGSVWAGTYQGLWRCAATCEDLGGRNVVLALLEAGGHVWAVTDGELLRDGEPFAKVPRGGNRIAVDIRGNVWVASAGDPPSTRPGLWRVDATTGLAVPFLGAVPSPKVTALLPLADGSMVVGTAAGTVVFGADGRMTREGAPYRRVIQRAPADHRDRSGPWLPQLGGLPAGTISHKATGGGDGYTYVDIGGEKYRVRDEDFRERGDEPATESAPPNGKAWSRAWGTGVEALWADDAGTIWLAERGAHGGEPGDLFRLTADGGGEQVSTWDFAPDDATTLGRGDDGRLWLVHQHGITAYDSATGVFRHIPFDDLGSRWVPVQGGDGELLPAGSAHRVVSGSGAAEPIGASRGSAGREVAFSDGRVVGPGGWSWPIAGTATAYTRSGRRACIGGASLACRTDGAAWIRVDGITDVTALATGGGRVLAASGPRVCRVDTNSVDGCVTLPRAVRVLAVDDHGSAWVGTDDGVYVVAEGTTTHLLAGEVVSALAVDGARTWVGTTQRRVWRLGVGAPTPYDLAFAPTGPARRGVLPGAGARPAPIAAIAPGTAGVRVVVDDLVWVIRE